VAVIDASEMIRIAVSNELRTIPRNESVMQSSDYLPINSQLNHKQIQPHESDKAEHSQLHSLPVDQQGRELMQLSCFGGR